MIKVDISLVNMDGFDAQCEEIAAAIDANLSLVADAAYASAKTTAAFIDKTGNLRKSITKRKSKFVDGGYIIKAAGSNSRKGSGAQGYHAHLIEFGHAEVVWGNRTGGRVAARPFMRPAKEVGIRKAIELFRSKT